MKRNFNKFFSIKFQFQINPKRYNNIYAINKFNYFKKTSENHKPSNIKDIKDIKDIPDLKDFMNMKTFNNKDSNEIEKSYLDSYEESRTLTEPQDHLDENKSLITKTFYIKTYGCQMNESDSEIVASILESNNFLRTDNMENVIFNTLKIKSNNK